MYNIKLLSELSGFSKRTIRYYIQKDLLSPPCGSCRGAYYTDSHLEKLEKIKQCVDQGVPLNQIEEYIKGKDESQNMALPFSVKPATWERIEIDSAVELHVRSECISKKQMTKISNYIKSVINGSQQNTL